MNASQAQPNLLTTMLQFIRCTLVALTLVFSATAQFGVLTVGVKCNSQTQTDASWQVDVTVTTPAGDKTVTVTMPAHCDAKAITAALAKKLNKACGLKHGTAPCFVNGETTNESGKVSARTAEDITAPSGYTFKSPVVTRKQTGTNDDGSPKYETANDHVQCYNGGTKVN